MGARDDVVEGQVVISAAILALEPVAQEDVEPVKAGLRTAERKSSGTRHSEAASKNSARKPNVHILQ